MATTKPAGTWITCADRKTAEDLRAKLDAELGFPKAGVRVSATGYAKDSPVHVTEHYAPIEDSPTTSEAAVMVDSVVEVALAEVSKVDVEVAKLSAATLDATWEKASPLDTVVVAEEALPVDPVKVP
jgi:hypothetical protein